MENSRERPAASSPRPHTAATPASPPLRPGSQALEALGVVELFDALAQPLRGLQLVQDRGVVEVGLLEGLFLVGRERTRKIALNDLVIANVLSIHTRIVTRVPRFSQLVDHVQPAL